MTISRTMTTALLILGSVGMAEAGNGYYFSRTNDRFERSDARCNTGCKPRYKGGFSGDRCRNPGFGGGYDGGFGEQPGYGAQQPGLGGSEPGLGGSETGLGGSQPGVGSQQPGFGTPQPGIGAEQSGLGSPAVGDPPSSPENGSDLSALMGVWQAVAPDASGGQQMIRLTLRPDGTATLNVPTGGRRISIEVRFSLAGGELQIANDRMSTSLGQVVSASSEQVVLKRNSGRIVFNRP